MTAERITGCCRSLYSVVRTARRETPSEDEGETKEKRGGGKRKGEEEMRIEDEVRIDEERAHCPYSAPRPSG